MLTTYFELCMRRLIYCSATQLLQSAPCAFLHFNRFSGSAKPLKLTRTPSLSSRLAPDRNPAWPEHRETRSFQSSQNRQLVKPKPSYQQFSRYANKLFATSFDSTPCRPTLMLTLPSSRKKPPPSPLKSTRKIRRRARTPSSSKRKSKTCAPRDLW